MQATPWVPILLAASPLRAMRSAPVTAQVICPRETRCATAPSAMRVTSMPSRISSHAVSRAPCRTGRVSSAITRMPLPWACAARITASAVPSPAVASAPALQWVSTVAPSGISAAPCSPILRLASTSSA